MFWSSRSTFARRVIAVSVVGMTHVLSRRQLLTAAAASPFVLAAGVIADEPVPEDQKIGFAIAGLGSYATNQILPNIARTTHCRVTALVTGDPEGKGQRIAEQYGVPAENVVTYDDIGKLSNRAGVDVLYVITPTGLHMQHTLAGFDAGMHVLCEKPMATDVGECDRMIQAGQDAGKQLMIGYRVHFEPHNQRAIEMAREEKVGPLRHFEGTIAYNRGGFDDTWRSDYELAGRGGPLMDLGIYMVNAARYITGEEPFRVLARFTVPADAPARAKGLETRCSWHFDFPSGVTASSTTGYDLSGGNTYRVIGSNGWFELEPATAYGGIQLFERAGRSRGSVDDIDERNQFATMLDHFATSLKENKPNLTPGEEGRRDVHVMRRIYDSAREGRALEL